MEDITDEIAALRRTAAAILGCASTADDIAQEAWLTTEGCDEGPPTAAARTPWLRGIARNLARRRLASTQRDRAAQYVVAQDLRDSQGDSEPGSGASADPTSDAAILSETAAKLARAVHGLPDHYRDVVVRRFWLDESPAQIAATAGVPTKTVSNRLHRALQHLRRTMQPDTSAQSSYSLLGVVALAAPSPDSIVPVTIAMKSSSVPFVLAVVLAAVSTLWFTARDFVEGSTTSMEVVSAGPDLPVTEAPRTSTTPSIHVSLPAVVLGSELAAPVTATREELAPKEAGAVYVRPATVTLAFVDDETGEPIKKANVRGATDRRFIERTVKTGKTVDLSPGEWSFAIQARPFEPVEIGPFVLASGQSLTLPTVRLMRGWASVASTIDVHTSIGGEGPFEVFLYGQGRSPCGRPSPRPVGDDEDNSRCVHCGYGKKSSIRTVAAHEFFQFDHLSAGRYRAVVFDVKGRMRFNDVFDIERGEAKRLDLRMEFSNIEFIIEGPDGAPFLGRWIEDDAEFQGPVEFYFSEGVTPCASACTSVRSSKVFKLTENGGEFVEDHPERTYLRDPEVIRIREGLLRDISTVWQDRLAVDVGESISYNLMQDRLAIGLQGNSEAKQKGNRRAKRRQPEDHVRNEHESPHFAPWSAAPDVRTKPIKARMIAPGRYRVDSVPDQADSVFITCGPYYVKVSLDPMRAGAEYELQLLARCAVPSNDFIGAKSCFSCHKKEGIAELIW